MNMKGSPSSGTDQFRSLQILDELSNDDSLTQRDLSGRLGIALGLVNSYIKNLAAKGYITVKSIPPKRYAYYLTPKGFAEKTRLTYDMLHDYTRIYREARKGLKALFHRLQENGGRNIVFVGADEVAEIAYITLQESDLKLACILDEELAGKDFFGNEIKRMNFIGDLDYDGIVITSYLNRDKLYKELLKRSVAKKDIWTVFPD